MIKKLEELGFELVPYRGEDAYVLSIAASSNMRFSYDFVYYTQDNEFYINAHKLSGLRTISEDDLIRNHNELNTPAKQKWLEIKEAIKDYTFNISK